jgi:Tol biopolymer transport system component
MSIEINTDEVRRHVESILASEGFSGAPKLQRFLRYVVDQALNGHHDQIKESVIGFEVYQKPASYDPRLDATVRVEASKLRHRLDQYYDAGGSVSPIRISIPKGSYVPRFEQHSVPELPVPLLAPSPRTRWWAVALALVAALIVGWMLSPPSINWTPSSSRLSQLTDFASFAVEPALSPDGAFVVFATDRNTPGVLNLWRQKIAGGPAMELTRLPNTARMPTISPDGRRIVFRFEGSVGVLAMVPIDGGEVTPIDSARRARHPRYSPVDQRLAYWVPQDEQTLDHGSVYLLNVANLGTDPARLFAEFAHASQPVWSGRGTHIVVSGTWQSNVPDKEYDAWTIEIGGGGARGEARKTGLFPLLDQRRLYRNTAERARVQISDWRDDWLYFSAPTGDGDNLFRIQLKPGATVSGEPEPLTTGAGGNTTARAGPKRLVFANSLTSYNLYSAPFRPASGVERITRETGINLRASVDRSGRKAGWERRRSAGSQLWLSDLDSGQGRELGAGTFARVSPDGLRVAYSVLEGTKQAIYLENFAPGGPRRRICVDCGAPSDWNEAGTHLLYITGGRPNGIGLLEVESGRQGTLLDHPSYGLHGARFLVDANGDGWMALYADTGPRTRQIFQAPVKSFRPAAYQDWIPVTDGAHWDLSPAWSPDGRAIYFVSERDGRRCIWTQALDPVTHRPVSDPAPVHHFHTPQQTLMQSLTHREAEALSVAGGRLFFSLDQTASSLWLRE